MEVVIDIPLEWLFDMKNKKFCQTDSLYQKILNGTPLPEGHGRIGDLDDLRKCFGHNINDMYAITEIDKAPTIVEATEK